MDEGMKLMIDRNLRTSLLIFSSIPRTLDKNIFRGMVVIDLPFGSLTILIMNTQFSYSFRDCKISENDVHERST